MAHNITVPAGTIPAKAKPMAIFSPSVMDFLHVLSDEIRTNPILKNDAACAALSFWLRPKHLDGFRNLITERDRRLGRGILFHITPTNIPIMFAYSLCMGLLSGNNNVVRISPRTLPAVMPLCLLIDAIWSRPEFRSLHEGNALISYEHATATTDELSAACDGRIIWGGDATIQTIRQSPLPPRAIELVFADRYSIALFDAAFIQHCSETELHSLAHRFYNDTYDMDQNACSSPKTIFWLTAPEISLSAVQQRWWQAVAKEAQVYDLAPIKVSRKYTSLWYYAMTNSRVKQIDRYDTNLLYVYTLASLPEDISVLDGKLGEFFQYSLTDAAELLPYLQKKIQTITTTGIDIPALRRAIIHAGALGADRIVPVGQAMEMDIRWDGTNMIEYLSRLIG
jgi:hypothetical protein